jgi:hypothetical protein
MKEENMTKSGRIQQAIGIAFLCLIYYMIIDSAFHDVSYLIQNNPSDFWQAFGKYLIGNLTRRY